MTLTRWKLLAGILGTAIVGVALADPKCPADQPKTHSSNQQRPRLAAAPEVVSTTVPATLPLPFAEVVDKGTAPPVTPSTPSVPLPSISMLPPNSAALPPINVAPAPVSVALPKVGESPVLLPPTTDLPRTTEPAKRELPTIDLPKLEGAKVTEAPKIELAPPASTLPSLPTNSAGLPGAKPPIPSLTTVPVPLAELPKVDLPKTELPKVELPKVELPTESPKPVTRTPAVDIPLSTPPLAKPSEPAPSVPQLAAGTEKAIERTAPAFSRPDSIAPSESASNGVRVVVRLGMGQPKFEVMSGDDVLLKAVCDKIDVRTPSEKLSENMTPLKAAGQVRFAAPGCEGVCDALTVLPASGEVELTGNVSVRCRKGKGETEIQAASLKFKLGSAPAYTVPEPAQTTAYRTLTR